ncbi:MAG TPA: LytR family transcriptional regulator, partial [Chloroflexi bacterium]|nr:LytR family transcriptional regulator [Chloroflexota bacterium]
PPPGPLPRSQLDTRATASTILLLGVDGERAASDEIDALMLFHLDAESERAYLISIPRDLYVPLPGHDTARAGDVYRLGQQGGAEDGLTLARRAISDTVGLPVEHVALVRFESFVTLIDAIGGVNVRVPHPIDDPDFPDGRGGSVPFAIPVGPRHFDGATALRYARTLVVPAPGFDRAFRQRQLILAVHERITRLDLLPELIPQSSALWAAVKGGVETNVSLSDAIDLALLIAELGGDDFVTVDLGDCCTTWYAAPTGERELRLDPQAIEMLLEDMSNPALDSEEE